MSELLTPAERHLNHLRLRAPSLTTWLGLDDLSSDEQAELGRRIRLALGEVARRRTEGKPTLTDEQTYADVLYQHGIACEHPLPMRRALPFGVTGFECLACGSHIMPLINNR